LCGPGVFDDAGWHSLDTRIASFACNNGVSTAAPPGKLYPGGPSSPVTERLLRTVA